MLLLAPLPTRCLHSQPCSAWVWDRARPRWGVGVVPHRPQEGEGDHSPTVTTVSRMEKGKAMMGGSRPNSPGAAPLPSLGFTGPLPLSTGQQPKLLRDPSSKGLEAAQAPVLLFRPVAEPGHSITDCFDVKSDKAVPGSYSGASVVFLSMWIFRWVVFSVLKHHLVVLLKTSWGNQGTAVPSKEVALTPDVIQETLRPPSQKASDRDFGHLCRLRALHQQD